MRKDKLYFLTFISISVIFLIIASLGVKYFIEVSANQLIEIQLESSKREANEISRLTHHQLAGGIDRQTVIQNIQVAIENTHTEASFICAFDWSGKEVCHPDKTRIGQKVNSNQSLLNSLKEEKSSDKLYDLLMNQRKSNDNISTDNNVINSEIVYISPVKDSDLIIAAHINLDEVSTQTRKLKTSFYTIFALMGGLIILSSFFAVRIIGSYYEKQLELKNINLESELISLSKLNTDLVAYQQKVVEHATDEPTESLSESGKKRILTYIRNELIPIAIDEIAYIYTENTITYVLSFDGKKSTSNISLDDMFTNLDPSLFFRANRQFIISISAIEKIIKYGNSQLKIVVKDSDAEIIISKNKAAEFRQWLNI
ncbi:LytTR family transcriptional regulator DNA-binding domain-containing protein [Aquimarina gracilis]|uniref:LytTR family transcriptional regulator DNA-binding domain-containing protein n=1 Tax=Aquimarina gracilis TaxID=874422 RepID=A0ABU5ZX75_9FLAO|nr:LytTR family transcriptional regulator DNA-binding domain-containing protein [Aquimarina gracilis]MEB3346475.1 LytTR family transcriptional regulator DNA-binding domain-containing protein [Aquimarina gracilis]